MKTIFSASTCLLLLCAIQSNLAVSQTTYFDNHGRTDIESGGVRMIPIKTPKGTFNVWTKRTGNNPTIKVLLLHGGPGGNHEYLEAFDSYFPAAKIEYYYYDQLGSTYSDQPNEPELVNLSHYVEEVEQVRKALGLDRSNFYLYGQSWGGLLAIEYALKYQSNLKGLVISNMMASIPAYNAYAKNVLMPMMDKHALSEIKKFEAAGKYDDPKYAALLKEYYYTKHVLREPANKWPEPVERSLKHINPKIYIPMQGPSELGASGALVNWDRSKELVKITVPTLIMAARYDTMDPKYLKWMAEQFKNGHYLYCPNGSHLAMYDDQKCYFDGLIKFLYDVDAGN